MAAQGVDRDWRREGEPVVELTPGTYDRARIATPTTIAKVTKTQIITADDGRYNRDACYPVARGRYSDRALVSIHDPRVMVILAQQKLAGVGQQATNLASIKRKDPGDILADLAVVARAVHDAYREVARMLAEADRAERESDR